MSYLQRQKDAFRSNVQAAASKVTTPRNLAAPAPASAPSPAPSNTSTTSKVDAADNKRKREPDKIVYSQPETTGTGEGVFTQAVFAIDRLKKDNLPKTLAEILSFLSISPLDSRARQLATVLKGKQHPAVQFTPDPNNSRWDAGMYQFRPKIPVRTKEQLVQYLQRRPDAQGVKVSELKDGFATVEDAIDELELEHKVLVQRKKNAPHLVWSDDPTLHNDVDGEFIAMWSRTELPSVDDLVRKLLEAGQKPASEDPSKRIKVAKGNKEKKKRKARAGGKTTNTHMAHLLKDYSHLKP